MILIILLSNSRPLNKYKLLKCINRSFTVMAYELIGGLLHTPLGKSSLLLLFDLCGDGPWFTSECRQVGMTWVNAKKVSQTHFNVSCIDTNPSMVYVYFRSKLSNTHFGYKKTTIRQTKLKDEVIFETLPNYFPSIYRGVTPIFVMTNYFINEDVYNDLVCCCWY